MGLAHISFGHPGVNKLESILRRKYFIQNIRKICQRTTEKCHHCTYVKPQKNLTTIQPPPNDIETRPWAHYYADLVDYGAADGNGNRYLVTIMDGLTSFFDGIPVTAKTATTVADALVELILRHGAMHGRCVTDNGREIKNLISNNMFQMFRVHQSNISPHHPQGNKVENKHNDLAVKSRLMEVDHETWSRQFPFIRHLINNTPRKANNGLTAFEALTGAPIFFPMDNLNAENDHYNPQTWIEHINKWYYNTGIQLAHYKSMQINHETTNNTIKLKRGTKCAIWFPQRPDCSKKLFRNFQGPYIILRQITPNTYSLYNEDNPRNKVVRNLKHIRVLA